MKPIDSGDMEVCPAPEGKVKGLGILTIWELRPTWFRLQETQQTHPEMHVHTDRHTHTQGKYPPCPLQTDMQSHIRAVPSTPVLDGLTLNDLASVSFSPGVHLQASRAPGD